MDYIFLRNLFVIINSERYLDQKIPYESCILEFFWIHFKIKRYQWYFLYCKKYGVLEESIEVHEETTTLTCFEIESP